MCLEPVFACDCVRIRVCESCQSVSVLQKKIASDNYLGTTRVTTLDR